MDAGLVFGPRPAPISRDKPLPQAAPEDTREAVYRNPHVRFERRVETGSQLRYRAPIYQW